MHLFDKRGVSPLIATVLLIAFAVSLGAVIMNLGVDIGSKCEIVDVEFQTTKEIPRVCYNQEKNLLEFTVNNKGGPIDGFKVSASGDASDAEEFFVELGEFEKSPQAMKISGSYVTDVSLIPYLEDKGSIRVCSNHVKDYANIADC